ncbi:MAG: MATE family efflux transporter, partial [Pirellulales bacterium]|nr:MATE family efflux transporter [Pirellulales bacterium]
GRTWSIVRSSLSGQQHDYTKGNLHRAIILLAIPMMLELAMESVFAVVDIYFVAKLGEASVSAVGLTEAVMTLLYALAIGLSMGLTATVARRIGEADEAAASRATAQGILLGVGISIVVSVIGIMLAPQILAMMDASDEAITLGSGYTRVMLGGNVVIFLIHLINAAFRGAGDPFLAMKSLWLANFVNIVLDPCLIYGVGPFPELGVTGAAVATTIGRGSGVMYQLAMLIRGGGRLELSRPMWLIDVQSMVRLLRVSSGGILQFLIATASWIALMRIVSEFGDVAVAGYTISVRILMFTFLPAWGLSNAAATLTGQNLGAKDPDRAERAVWLTGTYTMAFLALVTVMFLTLAPQLVGIFTAEPDVIAYGTDSLVIISYGYVAYAWGMVMMQAFNGAGDTMTPTRINLLCFWVVQIPLAWVLAQLLEYGPAGVFWSVMVSETLLAFVSIFVFRLGKWKHREV